MRRQRIAKIQFAPDRRIDRATRVGQRALLRCPDATVIAANAWSNVFGAARNGLAYQIRVGNVRAHHAHQLRLSGADHLVGLFQYK